MKSKIFSTCILEELWQFVFGNAPEDTARTIASTVDRLNLVDAKCSIWHFVKKKDALPERSCGHTIFF